MKNKKRNLWPVLTLFFLAPAIGELLSGSAPPLEFFEPLGFFVMVAMYGSGAILIRELRVRWNKGWPTVLTLGAAYGIIEEGLACKSFFNPQWGDLGLLGVYGRWAGVNWIWSIELIIYHSVISIAIPILLVELMFPAQRDERWLGRWRMVGFLLFADTLFAFAVLPYYPSVWTILLTITVIVALFFLARRLPTPQPPATPGRVPRPLWFAVVGFVGLFVFFFIFWGFPELAVPIPLTVLITIGLIPLVLWIVKKMSRGGAWTDEHQLALAGGALMFFVLLSPIHELDPTRPDNTTGMIAVGLVTLIFIIWLWRRVKRQNLAVANSSNSHSRSNRMNTPPRTHKYLFWLNLGLISTFFAEIISGSDPFPYFHFWGIAMVVPIYLLHTLILITIIYRRGRPTLPALYSAGTIFGLYEAYITKILWNPDWDDAVIKLANIAVAETLVLVFFWHVWMSFIFPLLAAETWLTGSNQILARFPQRLQRLFSVRKGWLILAVLAGMFVTINTPSPQSALLSGLGVIAVLGLFGGLWRRLTRDHQYTIEDLLPNKREFTVLVILLVGIYLLTGLSLRPEAFPSLLGHLMIWILYGVCISLLILALRVSRQSASPDNPLLIQIPQRFWVWGIVIFALTSALIETVSLFFPLDGIIGLLGWYGVVLLGLLCFILIARSLLRECRTLKKLAVTATAALVLLWIAIHKMWFTGMKTIPEELTDVGVIQDGETVIQGVAYSESLDGILWQDTIPEGHSEAGVLFGGVLEPTVIYDQDPQAPLEDHPYHQRH